jgi:hypothetical protein
VFVVGPDKKIKLMLVYPMTTGRNFDEVLRVIDSMQLTAAHKVATPVNWKPGDDVIIVSAVSDEEAKQKYPDGWKAPKPYLRIVPQPVTSSTDRIRASRDQSFASNGFLQSDSGPELLVAIISAGPAQRQRDRVYRLLRAGLAESPGD